MVLEQLETAGAVLVAEVTGMVVVGLMVMSEAVAEDVSAVAELAVSAEVGVAVSATAPVLMLGTSVSTS